MNRKIVAEIWLGKNRKPRFAFVCQNIEHNGSMYTLRDPAGCDITVHESNVVLYYEPLSEIEYEQEAET
ncbi:MAG: hypothetical protein E7605_04075 [Ruminococcaceae bacterium]|nr:hypothetical protein [Oscillospiraceae bacterium]